MMTLDLNRIAKELSKDDHIYDIEIGGRFLDMTIILSINRRIRVMVDGRDGRVLHGSKMAYAEDEEGIINFIRSLM